MTGSEGRGSIALLRLNQQKLALDSSVGSGTVSRETAGLQQYAIYLGSICGGSGAQGQTSICPEAV